MLDLLIVDLWCIILPHLTQFDLYKLLLVCKKFYNNTILRKELEELIKWCTERAKFITVMVNAYFTSIQNYDNKSIIINKYKLSPVNVDPITKTIIHAPGVTEYYVYSIDEDDYFLFNFVSIPITDKNIHYYPNPRYSNPKTNFMLVKNKNLKIQIYIKIINTGAKHKYLYTRAGDYFNLYDSFAY